jgi:type IV secretory pathway VirB2 component (pilin)
MQVRLVAAIIGIVVWGYGLARDESTVRLVGIVVLAISLALRFAPKRFQGAERDSP